MRPAVVLLLLIATSGIAYAQSDAGKSDEVLRQRILLRERFNKGWDVQAETERERKARCRGEARKKFTAMHPIKRAKFRKECMSRPGR